MTKKQVKLALVYDASSKVKNEASLNDRLESGPCLLPLLFDILLRFRTGKIGLISDIKQAFLQIEISPEHRDYLRFLWYDDVYKSNPELIILRFARVFIWTHVSSLFIKWYSQMPFTKIFTK